MSRLLFTGGTVVTADGSFRADVLVEDEKIVAVGIDLPADGAETVDASGRFVMPGFIDAHTHMDMPFGGTVTADDWATATAGNRHGNVDYTPYEEVTFHGGPASVCVQGNLVYRDGEVVGERGSGRFVERSCRAANVEVKV